MIQVGDNVNVSLANGAGVITGEITVVPGNNMIYWTLVTTEGVTYVVGPSLVSMEKIN